MLMLQEQKNEYSSVSSSSRGRQDGSYSRDRDYRGRERPDISDHSEDYSYTDIQSGLTETKQGDIEDNYPDKSISWVKYVGIWYVCI